jgi:hypothetical protein
MEYEDNFPVAIIDLITAQALFGRENAVGENITIEYNNRLAEAVIVGISESVNSQFAGLASNFSGDDSESWLARILLCPMALAAGTLPRN